MTTAAFAEPVSGTVIVNLIIQAAATAALSAGVAALLSRRNRGRRATQRGEGQRTEFGFGGQPGRIIFARARVTSVQIEEVTNSTKTTMFRPNVEVFGPTTGDEQYWVNGREVIINGTSGNVESPPWDSTLGNFMVVQFKVGLATETAWADLISIAPDDWTVDHRGDGISQTLLTLGTLGAQTKLHQRLYSNGFPVFESLKRGPLVSDPRDPPMSPDKWSDNSVLVIADRLRKLGLPTDDAFNAIHADKADVLVPKLGGGTEKRSRISGSAEVGGDQTDGQLLLDMQRSTGTRIVQNLVNGEIRFGVMVLEEYSDFVAEFDLEWNNEISSNWQSSSDAFNTPNICSLTYLSPEQDWQVVELDISQQAWSKYQDEIDAYGEKPALYELPYCPSASQAQRIARRLFEEEREVSYEITTDASGLATWGCLYGTIPGDDFDQLPILVEVLGGRFNSQNATTTITVRRVPVLADWNPATDEADPAPQFSPLPLNPGLSKPDPLMRAIHVNALGNDYVRVELETIANVVRYEAVYRTFINDDRNLPNPWRSMEELGTDTFRWARLAQDLEGVDVQFRIAGYDNDQSGSPFSDIFETTVVVDNTAPSIPNIIVTPDNPNPGDASSVTVEVYAPNDLQVATMEITGPNSPGIVEAAPVGLIADTAPNYYTFVFPLPNPGFNPTVWTWTATARATDGTAGPTATGSFTQPAS